MITNSINILKDMRSTQPLPFMNKNKKYSKYQIGEYSYGKPHVVTWGECATLKIGKFCSIADEVTLVLGGEHKTDWVTTYPFWAAFKEFHNFPAHSGTKGDITIGNDVWIGMYSLILSGVTIGDGAVIGAGSVVSKDVESYDIVAGNPLKSIRKRFDQETINELLKIKWWDWDMQRIRENMPLLISNRISEFIAKNKVNR